MTSQPPPRPSAGPAIVDLVIDDLRERDRIGRATYGMPLRAHNGRDQLRDLYEELLDAAQYARAAICERDEAKALLRVWLNEMVHDYGDGEYDCTCEPGDVCPMHRVAKFLGEPLV